MQFLTNTNFDFVGKRRAAAVLSALVILAGIVSLIAHGGPNLSIDFRGGQIIEVRCNPAIDLGQVEGGYVQGAGWLMTEEVSWNEQGELQTHAPSTYKIPTCSDLAPDFRVELVQGLANREKTIYRSKAVGEPPLMLGLSAFHAIRDALADSDTPMPDLQAPATPEAVLSALRGAANE